MVKASALLVVISLALVLYTFVDCAMREDHQIAKLPKWGWLLLIAILGPPLGPIIPVTYLIVGRKGKRNPKPKKGKPRIIPPDDNPDFLRGL
jgi:hypothetical protein